jgi:hypothetical protein
MVALMEGDGSCRNTAVQQGSVWVVMLDGTTSPALCNGGHG